MKQTKQNKKTGAFIIPTGIGASIGGYAGDASIWARKFAEFSRLIVNPNVVNAACFSGITDNMLYVEGYSLDEFFKGNIDLIPSKNNKIGVVFDKNISQDVLNIHINTINAVKTVYGIDIIYEITQEPVNVGFFIDESGVSTGKVSNIEQLLFSAENLLQKGADAIAVVCKFDNDNENENYENGTGVDPIGGAEAIISHYLSKELKVPVAHAPAFEDFSISTKIVNPKASAEYITPTFLPCILIGLAQAPQITQNGKWKARMDDDMCSIMTPSPQSSPIKGEEDQLFYNINGKMENEINNSIHHSPFTIHSNKYRIKLTKTGILRYFSHLDWQNTFLKALARTGLNIAFSQGFNPTMKVSMGVALPLFVESECELTDIEIYDDLNLEDLQLKLQKVMPEGCKILSIVKLDKSAKAIDNTVQWAEYEIKLFTGAIQKFENLRYNMNRVLSSEEILLTKKNKKGFLKTTNIKPAIKSYRFSGESLFIVLKTGQGGEIPALRADDLMKIIEPEVLFDIKRIRFFDENVNEIIF